MTTAAEIREFLTRHDFAPRVRRWGDGCVVTMPHPRLLAEGPRHVEAMAIRRGAGPGLLFNTSLDDEERFASVPEYAIRLVIQASIAATCRALSIPPVLVVYEDARGRDVGRIEGVIDDPSAEGERRLEAVLLDLFGAAREAGFPAASLDLARQRGVLPGYELARTFYDPEE